MMDLEKYIVRHPLRASLFIANIVLSVSAVMFGLRGYASELVSILSLLIGIQLFAHALYVLVKNSADREAEARIQQYMAERPYNPNREELASRYACRVYKADTHGITEDIDLELAYIGEDGEIIYQEERDASG
jgi:divalent metal cation (Fe/Co/Zn/Cd) transporter